MAPPITVYVGYTIFFTDPVEYAAAVTLCGGNGYGHCPFTAASTFGIPWPLPSGDMAQIPKGMWGAINFGIPDVPGPGKEIYFPGPSGIFMKSDVDSVVVPGQAGTPATIWPAGPDGIHKWWADIILLRPEITGTVPTQAPIPKRRWICGFEIPGSSNAELAFQGGGAGYTIDSSRALGGRGLTVRGATFYSPVQHNTVTYYGAGAKKTSWERFYIRINSRGATEIDIWRCRGTVAVNAGAILKILPTGQFKAYSNSNVNVQTALATSPTVMALDRWHKIDVLITWSTGGLGGQLRVYIDGVFDFIAPDNTGNGLDNNESHIESWLGCNAGSDANWDIDFDDWICADVPNIAGVESLTSVDWLSGTHIRSVNMVSGTTVGWTGPKRTLQQWIDPFDNPGAGTYISTATPGVVAEILTDQSNNLVDPGATVVGPVAMAINAYTYYGFVLGEVGQLGYRIAGGAAVLSNINEGTGFIWGNAAYLPSLGVLPPTSFAPLYLQKVKGPGVNTNIIQGMGATIEYIGVWGQEDDPNYFDLSNNLRLLQHNYPFGNIQESIIVGGPIASFVYAVGGTYAGNNDEVTITLPAPPHMIFIRPTTGGTEGTRWFSAGIGGSEGGNSNIVATRMLRVWTDDTGQGYFTVAGNEVNVNETGRTYQYIAFCDTGSRFCYNLAYNARSTLASITRNFFDPNWLPQAGWQQRSVLNSAGGPQTQSYKGAGNAGTTGQTIQGTAQANWGSWVAGQITLGANNIFATNGNVNISLWREFDDDGYCMVQIFSYTGDGNAFRTINFPHATGRWPLWAVVIPHGATGYARDPSNAANSSYSLDSLTNSNTSIVGGGVDLINVGSNLNSNGVVYEVFVILGDDDGWNNGAFGPPAGLATGNYQIPVYNPVVVGDGGLNFNGQPPLLVVKNLSGIYTLVPGKTDDTFYTGFNADTVDVKKPDPTFKTGYIGG